MTKSEGFAHLERLCDSYLSDERSSRVKEELTVALEDRGELIARYALYEITRATTKPISETDDDLLAKISYYFG